MRFIRKHFAIILLFILGVIGCIPLFFPGLPVTHDGQDHVARVAAFYKNLSEGVLIPRWAGNLNWGYGHPILMFLYPLPSYAASAFHFLGFSLVDSTKLVFITAYIASGLFMYLWVKEMWGEKAGLIAGVVYMYSPYRFVDLHVRGAIGEHVAFVFIPLICFFLLFLSRKITYFSFLGLALSLAGLILSHNAITLMFLPIIFLYGLILTKDGGKKFAVYSLTATVIGFGLSSFFLVPAFFEGKYTLRDIVTGNNEYRVSFVNIIDFINPFWSFGGTALLSKQIGIAPLIGIIFSVFLFWRSGKNEKLLLILFGALSASLFLMLPVSDFLWQQISIIQKFQFPWRFLSVVVFVASVICAYPFVVLSKKAKNIYFVILFLLLVISSAFYIRVQGYQQKDESFYSGIYYSTTDTGESAPRWSVRFMEKTPNAPIEVIDGDASFTPDVRTSTYHSYAASATKNTRVRENTLYFPDWTVYVNGESVPIEFQDPQNRGLITFFIPNGESKIEVVFEDTKLRTLANSVSIGSIILLLILFLTRKRLFK